MKQAEFPTAAIPGHGQRNHHAAGTFERVIGAADAKMNLAIAAHIGELVDRPRKPASRTVRHVPDLVRQRNREISELRLFKAETRIGPLRYQLELSGIQFDG